MAIVRGRVISRGIADGEVMLSREPISFFGGVDADTGIVVETEHPLNGRSISRRILVFPRGRGSTVGSYTLYRLKQCGRAPAAILNLDCEAIVAVGAIISEIPAMDRLEKDLFSFLADAQRVRVNANDGFIETLESS